MASTIQVDKIQDTGGNTILSSNSTGTFTYNGIAASAIDSGTLAVARGGTGTTSYTPGLTVADEWLLTSAFQGDADPIASNLSRIESVTSNVMTESSGIFTFPLTGFYLIMWNVVIRLDGGSSESERGNWYTRFTTDNSSYDFLSAPIAVTSSGTNTYTSTTSTRIVDVTDVTQCKVKFGVDVSNSNTYTRGGADPGESACRFVFLRLGDT
jgi:hypothetical protein